MQHVEHILVKEGMTGKKWEQELKEGYNRKGDLCFQNR
jgi:hypothetical protein